MSDKYTIHTLEQGESLNLHISSRTRYSNGQLHVSKGQSYSFKVDVDGPKWWDLVIPTYGDGWDMFLSPKKGRRVQSKPLLHLCGCIDKEDSNAFGIGNSLDDWLISKDGKLSFFANDYPTMYFNNWGKIRLEITRLS